MIRSTFVIAAAAAAFLTSHAYAETMTFHATMNGATEVPAKTTDGKGHGGCLAGYGDESSDLHP